MLPRSVSMMTLGVVLVNPPVLGVVPQVSVSHGIEFVTVGDPGNPGFDGHALFEPLAGAGSIPYEYRLSRTEITSGQWIEFANAVAGLGSEWARFSETVWFPTVKAEWLPSGGLRYTLMPGAEDVPVQGMSFMHAALYANWLNNNKAASLDAIRTGAYDLTRVGVDGIHLTGPAFTYEDLQPLPGAKFWVPSIGEWMKGGFYDPDKNGTGPGWWNYANSKDRVPVYGPPGQGGESNAGVLSSDNAYYLPDAYYWDFLRRSVSRPAIAVGAAGCVGRRERTDIRI